MLRTKQNMSFKAYNYRETFFKLPSWIFVN